MIFFKLSLEWDRVELSRVELKQGQSNNKIGIPDKLLSNLFV